MSLHVGGGTAAPLTCLSRPRIFWRPSMARAVPHWNSHVALVTGANHGIGAATARALAARGVRVVITYFRLANEIDTRIPEIYRRSRASTADAVVAAIHAMGGASVAMEADLVDASNIPLLFDQAEREFGPVDILVNNASAGWRTRSMRTSMMCSGCRVREWRQIPSIDNSPSMHALLPC
jgi:NAD(P)-dependent dehydrogenase (short-subunit alcohol dehydrogenase family)